MPMDWCNLIHLIRCDAIHVFENSIFNFTITHESACMGVFSFGLTGGYWLWLCAQTCMDATIHVMGDGMWIVRG